LWGYALSIRLANQQGSKITISINDFFHDRYQKLKRRRSWRSWPLIRHLRAIRFRRLNPIDNGKLTGLPVVRYYWAEFLTKHQTDIRGHALEIGETTTIRHYGGAALTQADALDMTAHSPEVRVVANLSEAEHVPGDRYDCFVVQFTANVLYDIEPALYHAIRLLKPGGVLLINFWCVDYYLFRGLDMGTGSPVYMHWWFTPIQVENMLRRLGLTEQDFQLEIYGNLLTRMAFLMNLNAEELTPQERNHVDPGHPLLICARIVKPADWHPPKPRCHELLWTPTLRPAEMRADTVHYGDDYLKR
jgi:hypothetical protein